jgi:3-hydroxyisobutyrate dehydrogenase-like beta-hydroxyacid dehydrogenase
MTGARPALGYIGVGLMGLPMVRHLLHAGWRNTAYDIDEARLAEAAAAGAHLARSPAECADNAELVVLNLPHAAAVLDVVSRPDGLLHAAGKLIVDFSTLGVEATRNAAGTVSAAGSRWLDAPVSGGPGAAADGSLAVMVGGAESDVDAARPLLDAVAAHWTHMGALGAGQAAKLVNQLIVGANHIVLAEAVRLCEGLGIEAARIPDCLAGGHADSTLLRQLFPRMARRDLDPPRGYAGQLAKDLSLVQQAAASHGLALPMTGLADEIYAAFVAAGEGKRDSAAIIDSISRQRPG